MADVRKLLQAERRLRETNAPKSNSTKRTHPEIDDAAATKRRKTTVNIDTGLPEDFFDGEDEGGGTDRVLESDNGVAGTLSRTEKGDMKIKEGDASMVDVSNATTNSSILPSDFFEANSSIPSTARVDVDEDEWAAFQADVAESTPPVTTSVMVIEAAPTSNNATVPEEQDVVDDFARGEEEDAKQKLMDEFEEMESLEQRVLRLKERREALKSKAPVMPKTQEAIEVGLDDQRGEEDEDEDEDEDADEDFFRVRRS